MGKKAMLILAGRQRDESGEESVTESRAEAEYYEKDGSSYILYEEASPDGKAPVKNIIKYRDRVLEITRRGGIRSRMIFEAGCTCRSDYVTPYGTLSLEVSTRKAEIARLQNRIRIRLDYSLSSEGRFLSDCTLDIDLALPEN